MFIVLSAKADAVIAMKPSNHGGLAGDGDGKFKTLDEAKAFAEWCAKKWPGNEYCVMGVLGRVKTIDPVVEWK